MVKDGKERDSKNKKKRSASSSSDESKSRRRRRKKENSSDDDVNNHTKRSRKHKSYRRHSSSPKEDCKEKRRTKHKRPSMRGKIEEISKDDYFVKNNEFACWLNEEKKVFFSDLKSQSAREMFLDFVKEWNEGNLETRYYEGIAKAPRSGFNWGIKS